MEMTDEKITIGMSLFLSEIVTALLYKEEEINGKKSIVERELPFRLKYRLVRNKAGLDRDVKIFNEKKLYLLAKYGEPTPDGKEVIIKTKENYEKYSTELEAVFDTPITHNILTLEPEDIDTITENIPMSTEATSLFVGYMTNDPKLYADLVSEVKFNLPEFKMPEVEKKPEEKTSEKKVVKSSVKTTNKSSTTVKSTKNNKKDLETESSKDKPIKATTKSRTKKAKNN